MIEMTMENVEKLRKMGAAKIELSRDDVEFTVEFYPQYENPTSKELMNMSFHPKSNVDEFEEELDNISNMQAI